MILLYGCGEKKVEETAPIVKPVKSVIVGQNAVGIRTLPGTVQAANRSELSFRVGGPLIDFPVKEGQKIQKGQLLARVDPRDYRIAVESAKAKFNKAEADFKRYRSLYEKDAVPLADLDLYRSQRDVAKSALDNAQADLNDTYLRAPFSGEVGETYFDTGEDIKAKEPVLGLHGTNFVEIIVDVSEALRAKFDPEKIKARRITAKFSFAPEQEFDVTLTEFSAAADSRTQTYKATFSMPQPEGINIQPGMTSAVRAYPLANETDQVKTEFTIPSIAVFTGPDGTSFVWIVDTDAMIILRRAIEVGSVTGQDKITVLSGISAGERIVVAGVTTLRDSAQVSLMEDFYNLDGGK
jgi:RND family efflux transporter MFP subunit